MAPVWRQSAGGYGHRIQIPDKGFGHREQAASFDTVAPSAMSTLRYSVTDRVNVEDTFDVELEEEKYRSIHTVGELTKYIEKAQR